MRLSRDFIHMLFESSPNGLLVIDVEARITLVNEAAEQLFGYSRDELLGKSVESLVPERFRAQHKGLLRSFLSAPLERPMGTGRDLTAVRRDGSEFPVEIGLKPMRSDGQALVLVTVIDITERKRTEDRHRLLIGELNHRIQNLFAVVQAVALHSLSGNRSLLEAREVFIDRLQSLGRTYTLMTEQQWRGAPLRQILTAETSAFSDRVHLDGADVMVRQNAAQSFALLLHELTTNAIKYGALSRAGGEIDVRWGIDGGGAGPAKFTLSWLEKGGPSVAPPTRSGYGRKIIEDTIRRIGKYQIEYAHDGLKYRMEAPLEKVGWVIEKKHDGAAPEEARGGSA